MDNKEKKKNESEINEIVMGEKLSPKEVEAGNRVKVKYEATKEGQEIQFLGERKLNKEEIEKFSKELNIEITSIDHFNFYLNNKDNIDIYIR